MNRGGIYVRIAMSDGVGSLPLDLMKSMRISLTGVAKCIGGVSRNTPEDLRFIKQLIEAGQLPRPRKLIDRQRVARFFFAGRCRSIA